MRSEAIERSMVVQATPLRVRRGDRRDTRPRRQRTWECDHIPLALIVLDRQRHRQRPMRMRSLRPNKPIGHSAIPGLPC